ncbi:MAG: M14 family zinc carboxypeptidase [Dokdonella sp.]
MLQRILISAIATCTLAAGAHAEDWFVEAHYDSAAAIAEVAAHFQHLAIDRKRRIVRVDTDEEGIAVLERAGMQVRIDLAATAQMRTFYDQAKGVADSIPGYACYRTVEETYATIDAIVQAHPDIATVTDIGPTWEKTQNSLNGYSMRALRVTRLATAVGDPDRPTMVLFGSIHAREYTAAELVTRFAEWLVNNDGSNAQATWLIDHTDFRLVLQANPDGRKKAESGLSWRKNTNRLSAGCAGNPNNSGVDLNRNFSFNWNSTGNAGSSPVPCDTTFRGAGSASEPETQNLRQYVAGSLDGNGVYGGGALPDKRIDDRNVAAPLDYPGLFFDMHSYGELVLWPWGDTTDPAPNSDGLQTFGRRVAFRNGHTPEQADTLYPTDGTTKEMFYGGLGAPSYTIELGMAFFESCSSFENNVVAKNLNALRYAARAAHAAYRLPGGPDVSAITITPNPVVAGTPVQITATIDDTGYNQTNGTQLVRTIKSASATVDLLPWQAGAVPIALGASDGTFNTSTEAINGMIPTNSLGNGRHLIYIQGVDNDGGSGIPGTPDAVFLDVIVDPIFQSDFDG